jgi:hypothetical protein
MVCVCVYVCVSCHARWEDEQEFDGEVTARRACCAADVPSANQRRGIAVQLCALPWPPLLLPPPHAHTPHTALTEVLLPKQLVVTTPAAAAGGAGQQLAALRFDAAFASSSCQDAAEQVWQQLGQAGPPLFLKVRTREALATLEQVRACACVSVCVRVPGASLRECGGGGHVA